MSVTFKKVWKDITHKKLRSILVVMSIAIGVFGISTVLGTGTQLNEQIRADYLNSNPADVVAFTGYVSADLLADVAALPNVTAAEGALVFNTRWRQNLQWETLIIEAGPSPDTRQIDLVGAAEGSTFSRDGILVERTAQDLYSLTNGQEVIAQTPSGEVTLKVNGFAKSNSYPPAQFSNVSVAFVSFDQASRLFGQDGFNMLRLKLDDPAAAAATETALRDLLTAAEIPVLNLTVRDPDSFPGQESISSIFSLMGVLGALALVLSGFLVTNTIVTVIASETRQIGTMKAIGATRWMVMRLYLSLVFGYGLLASVVGIALGMVGTAVLTNYITGLTNIDVSGFELPVLAIVAGLAAGLVTPAVAAFIPVWQGTGITVREAITDYGIMANTGRLERFLARLHWLPFTASLGMRNTFRNRKRAWLTLLTLSVAGAAFMTVQATSASLNRTVDELANTYRADVFVEFDLPVTRESLADVVPDDAAVAVKETWLDHPAVVADTEVTLNGAPFDTQLYERSRLVDGRWFTATDTQAIIIQEKFAADHELVVGDTVFVDLNASQVRWQVIGIVRDYNESGNAPLVPYTQLADELGFADRANFILLQLSDRSQANITAFSQQLDEMLPRLGVQGAVFTIDDVREQAEAGFQVIVLFLLAMVILVAFVGGLGLFGTLTINVTERQKEIGVMRSVGASNGAIVKIFWLEGIFLGIFGWIIAALIGYPLAQLFTQLLSDVLIPVEFYLPPSAVILLGVGMMLLVSLSSVMPALSAARSRVSDIIRYA